MTYYSTLGLVSNPVTQCTLMTVHRHPSQRRAAGLLTSERKSVGWRLDVYGSLATALLTLKQSMRLRHCEGASGCWARGW